MTFNFKLGSQIDTRQEIRNSSGQTTSDTRRRTSSISLRFSDKGHVKEDLTEPLALEPRMKVNESSRSFLLLCLADGSIYSLEAWTGEYQSLTRTAPLLSSSSRSQHESIVPSLDGRLYWRPSPPTIDGDSILDDEEEASLPLQELPLTVAGLLDHPVRSCNDGDDTDCGILTAHTTTSLLALSESGSLLWKTAPDDDVEYKM